MDDMVSQAAGSQSAGLSAHQCTTLYLVLPCYNEEEVLMDTAAALVSSLENAAKQGEMTLIDIATIARRGKA